jgi:hypothetical protein
MDLDSIAPILSFIKASASTDGYGILLIAIDHATVFDEIVPLFGLPTKV